MQNSSKQHTLWLLAAVAAPAAHFSGCGWFMACLAALILLPLSLLQGIRTGMPRPIALLQILWIGAVAGWLLTAAAVYWPSDNDLAVPLTILVLAAVTNAAAAPRIGAVLAFCMALLAVPLSVSGAAHLKFEWLRPSVALPHAGLLAALLLPVLPAAGEGKRGKTLFGVGVLTVLTGALIQAVISPKVAGQLSDAFYQTARSLGYLEPVTAVAMTLGWYAMAVFLLKNAEEIAKTGKLHPLTANVLFTGTAGVGIVFKMTQSGWILVGIGLIMWVLIPFGLGMKKSAGK